MLTCPFVTYLSNTLQILMFFTQPDTNQLDVSSPLWAVHCLDVKNLHRTHISFSHWSSIPSINPLHYVYGRQSYYKWSTYNIAITQYDVTITRHSNISASKLQPLCLHHFLQLAQYQLLSVTNAVSVAFKVFKHLKWNPSSQLSQQIIFSPLSESLQI